MAVDTFTLNLNLTKPGVGGSADTWGAKLNANFDVIDEKIQDNADTIALIAAGAPVTSDLGTAAYSDIASTSQVRAGTSSNILTASNVYAAAAPVNSSGSGTWAPDLAAGRVFERTMTNTTTLADPTNALPGMSGVIFLRQGGSGGHTLNISGGYKIAGGQPLIPQTANALFGFGYLVMTSSDIRLNYLGEFT